MQFVLKSSREFVRDNKFNSKFNNATGVSLFLSRTTNESFNQKCLDSKRDNFLCQINAFDRKRVPINARGLVPKYKSTKTLRGH